MSGPLNLDLAVKQLVLRQGLEANITISGTTNSSVEGEPLWTTDTNVLYIFNGSDGIPISLTAPLDTKTSAYTIVQTDGVIICNSASDFTVTLPLIASGTAGREYVIKNINTGIITVDGFLAETIDDSASQTLNQYDSITIISDGSEWRII